MNAVHLTGRLTKDPDLKATNTGKSVCRFNLAVNRPKRQGEDTGADFPTIVCWNKTAENAAKYLRKGSKVAVNGKIHTDKYEKDGRTIYTVEVWADDYDGIEFLDSKGHDAGGEFQAESYVAQEQEIDPKTGYAKVNTDDLPF